MTIEKFLHSCLRVTHDGHRLLTDPGSFCFADGRVRPEDLGPVDVILLTHEHQDHFDPEALRKIIAAGQPTILAHPPLAEKVRAAGLSCDDIAPGATRAIGGFTIEAMETPHGPLPIPVPPHCGYSINGSLYHPGDSLVFPTDRPIGTLAVPIAGPWCLFTDAVRAAVAAKPKRIIPIHDAIIQDFFIERMYWMVGKGLEGTDITFHPLPLGATLEVPVG